MYLNIIYSKAIPDHIDLLEVIVIVLASSGQPVGCKIQ